MVKSSPKDREIFSPVLMVIYVDFLLGTQALEDFNVLGGNNFIRMMIFMLYGTVDLSDIRE